MNYFGSYRRLLANSKSALVAAIEIYNKPRFEYRDEVFAILLVNAWELLLKALLSKARTSIYYPKERGQPYRTVGWRDALKRANSKGIWPARLPVLPLEENLRHLSLYRDSAVHYYTAPAFPVVVYLLAQTAIVNYRDVLREVFDDDLTDEITWTLLPLATEPPTDPLTYLRGGRHAEASGAVDEFISSLAAAVERVDKDGEDRGRLITVYDVSLRSVRKIERSDFVVGVKGEGGGDPIYIEKTRDTADVYPFLQKTLLKKLASEGRELNQYGFQAVVHHFELRGDPKYHHEDEDVNRVRWSPEVLGLIRRLDESQIAEARENYREHLRLRS